jgi:outer membrane protein assembly factor BamE (lipoprotein component of BamABCDE complex)
MTIKRTLTGTLATAILLTLAPVSSTFAEELRVPVGTQADRGQQSVPRTGMTQASVRASWGQPASAEGPVGQPPISQWYYDRFVVYFESDRVIHSVLKPQR